MLKSFCCFSDVKHKEAIVYPDNVVTVHIFKVSNTNHFVVACVF